MRTILNWIRDLIMPDYDTIERQDAKFTPEFPEENHKPYERRCHTCGMWTTGAVSVSINGFSKIYTACDNHADDIEASIFWKDLLDDRR